MGRLLDEWIQRFHQYRSADVAGAFGHILEKWRRRFHQQVRRRSIAIVLAGVSLVVLSIFLLGANYLSQIRLRDVLLEQVRLDTDRDAETLSFFFETARDELNNLTKASEFSAYFANRALGMSMQYGLRSSLLELHRRLEQTVRQNGETGTVTGLFDWIAFVESPTGLPLARTGFEPPPTTNHWRPPPLPFDPVATGFTFWIPTDREPASVYAVLPYFFKAEYRGYLLAQLDSAALHARLLAIVDHQNRQFCLVLTDRCLRLLADRSKPAGAVFAVELPAAAFGQPVLLEMDSAMPADGRFYGMVARIRGTPLALATFTPAERISGRAGPEQLLLLTGLLSGIVLLGTFFLWRMDNQNLVLKMHVAEEKRRQEDLAEKNLQLYQLAHHDTLTGLPNRDLLFDRLEHAMVRARRRGGRIALLFLDLDRFKTINDSLGHPVGDQVLQAVARRLRDSIRETDTVARLSGDEFILLLEDIRKPDDAVMVAEKILDLLAQPFSVAGHEMSLSISIGSSLFPEDGETATELIRNADTAMYRAKEGGRNCYQRYQRDLTDQMVERFELERGLHGAAERGEFELYYQPQLSSTENRLVAAEALLRWRHPQFGLVSPGLFIPLAEETGHIHEIGAWVLRAACAQTHAWLRAGLAPPPIAVNISGQQIMRGDLPAIVSAQLTEWDITPEQLELEITETSLMRHSEQSLGILQQLRELGIQLAIDDFGTGYSSMSYMKRFKVNALKIDRSFVEDLPDDEVDCDIARAIIALAHSLGLRVVAEGVETAAQRDFLQAEGCDRMQGYLFGRPVPSKEFEQLLKSQAAD